MSDVSQVAVWLEESLRVVAFTGAGISTESGLPDFRSPGGVWAQNRTVYFDEFLSSEEDRYEYWRQKSLTHVEFEKATPNAAHEVLARWESVGKLEGVITQNIDGLHHSAGSQRIWELHGTAREIGCLSCEKRWPADPWVRKFLEEDRVPRCPHCSGLLKHATVSFGQSLSHDVLAEASQISARCDLFFALGSSLVVHPAAGLPELARRNGSKLVIVNRTETPLDDLADVVIRGGLGKTLSAIDAEFQSLADRDRE